MITQNKIKLILKNKSKILVLGLILVTLVSLFGFVANTTQASPANPAENCVYGMYGIIQNRPCNEVNPGNTAVPGNAGADPTAVACTGKDSSGNLTPTGCNPNTKQESALYEGLDNCGIIIRGSITGCIEVVTYFLFVTIPSFLMGLAAQIFNFMAAMTLSSNMYDLPFIQAIWKIIRDFANIFFILILLYAAFEIILGLGGGGAKKIVASVILIALVVNFSLFFTKIIIDSSNIAALIFYNKIDTSNTVAEPISSEAQLGVKEKNMAGALVSRFNVNTFFDGSLMEKLKEPTISWWNPVTLITGKAQIKMEISAYVLVSMMVAYGLVVYALTYAFFTTALSFLGRMITLMMLMIISPFAFVTAAVPKFKGIDTLGFDSWLKKLFQASFVALIFMFILYIISEILREDIFKSMADTTNKQLIPTLIQLFIPAILITILLIKGTSYAKKASGEFTGAIISGAKAAGVLALGGAALGTALAGRKTFGSVAKSVQNDSARAKDLRFSDLRNAAGNISPWKVINPFKAIPSLGKAASAGIATGIHKIPTLATDPITGARLKAGKYIQNQDRGFAQKTHAASILDQKAKSEYGHQPGYENVKYKDLTEIEQGKVNKQVDLDAMAKFKYGKQFKDLEAPEAQETKERYEVTGERPVAGPDGDINDVRVARAGDKIMSAAFVEQSNVSAAIGEFAQALRKGSYDIRNLPDMSAKSKGFPKLAVGVLAAAAAGVRMGLKTGAGADVGKGEKDFLTDLKSTISTALGNLKVNVTMGKGGGDDHPKEVKSVGH